MHGVEIQWSSIRKENTVSCFLIAPLAQALQVYFSKQPNMREFKPEGIYSCGKCMIFLVSEVLLAECWMWIFWTRIIFQMNNHFLNPLLCHFFSNVVKSANPRSTFPKGGCPGAGSKAATPAEFDQLTLQRPLWSGRGAVSIPKQRQVFLKVIPRAKRDRLHHNVFPCSERYPWNTCLTFSKQ